MLTREYFIVERLLIIRWTGWTHSVAISQNISQPTWCLFNGPLKHSCYGSRDWGSSVWSPPSRLTWLPPLLSISPLSLHLSHSRDQCWASEIALFPRGANLLPCCWTPSIMEAVAIFPQRNSYIFQTGIFFLALILLPALPFLDLQDALFYPLT